MYYGSHLPGKTNTVADENLPEVTQGEIFTDEVKFYLSLVTHASTSFPPFPLTCALMFHRKL